jgi:hypothetical protein
MALSADFEKLLREYAVDRWRGDSQLLLDTLVAFVALTDADQITTLKQFATERATIEQGRAVTLRAAATVAEDSAADYGDKAGGDLPKGDGK